MMSDKKSKLGKAALCAAFLSQCWTAAVLAAGTIGISPLRVDLSPTAPISTIRVMNTGDTPVAMQGEAMQWSQSDDGEPDQFEPTDDIITVPPIFTLEPGETQTVRVGFVGAPPVDQERSYRLFMAQLPPEGGASGSAAQLNILLRFSLPVFTAPAGPQTPALELLGSESSEDGLRVILHNSGNMHVRLQELAAMTAGGMEADRHDKASYLLPGSTRSFLLDVEPGDSVTRLIAVTDTVGTQEYAVDTR